MDGTGVNWIALGFGLNNRCKMSMRMAIHLLLSYLVAILASSATSFLRAPRGHLQQAGIYMSHVVRRLQVAADGAGTCSHYSAMKLRERLQI